MKVMSPPKAKPIGRKSQSVLPRSKLSGQGKRDSETQSSRAEAMSTAFNWNNMEGEDYVGTENEQLFHKPSKSRPSENSLSKCMPISESNFSKFARVHCGKAQRELKTRVSSGMMCGGYGSLGQISPSTLNEMFNRIYGIKEDSRQVPPPFTSLKLTPQRREAPKKEEHAFKRVWERQGFEAKDKEAKIYGEAGNLINWKQWPPEVPPYPFGVKIPVYFTEQIEYNFTGRAITEVSLGIEAQPKPFITRKEFESLKGILNIPRATSCTVTPSSVVFTQSKNKESYTAILKIHNSGSKSRRICIVRPLNNEFDVIWGAALNQKAMLPPGLSAKVIISFKPLSSQAMNDMITVLISDDGGLVIPLLAIPKLGPALEMEEFDCASTSVGSEKASRFNVKNFGESARFWILTEEEFVLEKFSERLNPSCINLVEIFNAEAEEQENVKSSTPTPNENKGIENELKELNQKILDKDTKGAGKSKKHELDYLTTESFRLNPSCFELEKGQEISLKVRFKPNKATFYFEKVVILCDNGEVRWVALKGTGIDIKSSNVVRVEGDWRGPPSDLPSDISTEFTLDLGDLLVGEIGKKQFAVLNLTTVPLTYFWSIRKIQSPRSPKDSDFKQDAIQRYPELSFNSSGITGLEEEKTCTKKPEDTEGKGDFENNNEEEAFIFPISIKPDRGILNPKEYTDIEVCINCPPGLGYHGCVISLFLEQNNDGPPGVDKFIEDMGGIDIDTLSLPSPPTSISVKAMKEGPVEQKDAKNQGVDEDIYAKLLRTSKSVKNLALPNSENCSDQDKHEETRKRKSKYKNLKPAQEIELWWRTIPMECYFKPNFILVSGIALGPAITRNVEFFNETNHPVAIELNDDSNDVCSISSEELLCKIEPRKSGIIKVFVIFRKSGTYRGNLTGKMILPFTEVECSIPIQVDVTGLYIEIMTPVINFGLVAHKAEKVKTITIRNNGHQRASWHAKLSKEILVDQKNNELSIPEEHINSLKLFRIWPDWGVLNPGETCGFQVYLFAEVTGSLATAIEITVEENADCKICVPVLAEIQYPSLFLEKSSIPMEIYANMTFSLPNIRLINPGGFLISFKWGAPMGSMSKISQIEISPDFGIVMPRTCFTCEINIIVERETIVDNLFIPCFVDGMREPLILELTGRVFGQSGTKKTTNDEDDGRIESLSNMLQLQMFTGAGDCSAQMNYN